MLKLVGTIIVHSILQGGPGLRIFSPSVYYYLATGDIDGAIQNMSVNDCSMRIKAFINKVSKNQLLFFSNSTETFSCCISCCLNQPNSNNHKNTDDDGDDVGDNNYDSNNNHNSQGSSIAQVFSKQNCRQAL